MKLASCALALMTALTLAACGSLKSSQTDCAHDPECRAKLARASDASCEAFSRPEFVVKGATTYDQRWADGNTEAGVGACGWERPKARPAELDKRPAAQPKAAPRPPAPKKVSMRTRLKRLLVPSAAAAPASTQTPPGDVEPAVTVVRTTPVPPPPPPDPLDELIGKRDDVAPRR